MKTFLTGSEGYIGSVLGPRLLAAGHQVTGLDTGYYSDGCLFRADAAEIPACLRRDVRTLRARDVEGCDAVVHLAELSNDPLGQLRPEVTHDINHAGTVNLARACREAGVARFVYTSSCSVYGAADAGVVTESSPVNPQTTYAQCKVLVEGDVSRLAGRHFSPVFLRNSTAYGASPRMRFDLVLNNLAGYAWTTREIRMFSDGTPWRPLVHVRDICEAILHALEAPREAVHCQILNVGDPAANYRVREVAEVVASVFPGCTTSFGPSGGDNRSYRVSFEKIREHLPAFSCSWDARKGAEELLTLFGRVELSEDMFMSRRFTRLKQLEYLIRTGQINDDFLWQTDRETRPTVESEAADLETARMLNSPPT
ncbi:MAG: SDR family oxidoreductase [Candidatus Eisenbacteria bacterium]